MHQRLPDGLWDRLGALRSLVMAEMQEGIAAMPGLDLTLPQSTTLFRIAKSESMSVSELQAALGRSQSTTSHLVSQLEKKRLVERRSDERDARRSALHLTKAGASLVRRVEQLRRKSFERVLGQLPAPVLRQFDEAMRAVSDALAKVEAR